MHVLIIPINFPNTYDRQGHVFFEEQAHALSLKGLDVGVLAITPISFIRIWKQKKLELGAYEYHSKGARVFRYQIPSIPKMRRLNSWLQTWFRKREFLKYQEKYGCPDIAHIHVSLAGKLAVWMDDTFQIPYVVTEHYTSFLKNNMPIWEKNLAKEVFIHSKRNIAVSKEFTNRLQNDFNLKFDYIPNLVDTDFFIPQRHLATTRPIRNFLNIGNLKPQKSQDMLIKAFAGSFKGKEEYRLTIAGSGPEYSRLNSLVSELGMQQQISFYGQADRVEVVMLMQKSDCFVLSSTFETFGVVVIEAMSCGLPVIATRSGGPENIILEKKLGILCDIDRIQLSNALTEVIGNAYDPDYIRKYAIANFSSRIIAKRLENLYSQVLGNKFDSNKQASSRCSVS